MDLVDYEENPGRLFSRQIDIDIAAQEGDARSRRSILAEIKTKLGDYGMYLPSKTASSLNI